LLRTWSETFVQQEGRYKCQLNAEHVYVFVLGDRVPHRHVHLIVRHPGAPQEYWGVRVDEWPEAPHGDEVEIAALVARLRAHLANSGTKGKKTRP
jgi:histidine triad (HIT) family protein